MKARIKATGEIIDVLKLKLERILTEDVDFVGADNGYLYKYEELDFNLNYAFTKS